MHPTPPAFETRLVRDDAGWRWRIAPPGAVPVSSAAPDLETAVRNAAFAAAVVQSLDRARRRSV